MKSRNFTPVGVWKQVRRKELDSRLSIPVVGGAAGCAVAAAAVLGGLVCRRGRWGGVYAAGNRVDSVKGSGEDEGVV